MKDGIANNSTASISQARKAVEQLKMEACMDRIKVQSFIVVIVCAREQIFSHRFCYQVCNYSKTVPPLIMELKALCASNIGWDFGAVQSARLDEWQFSASISFLLIFVWIKHKINFAGLQLATLSRLALMASYLHTVTLFKRRNGRDDGAVVQKLGKMHQLATLHWLFLVFKILTRALNLHPLLMH